MNIIQSRLDTCVKIVNINCNWSITLHGNCNWSFVLCSPDKMSLKSQTGPMGVFCTFTEMYINQEYMGLV